METPLSHALPALAGSLSPGGAADDLLRALTEHTPVGVFLSDTAGSCRFVNRRWCELTGLTVDQALGDGWVQALHPDDREQVQLEWAAAAKEERDSVVSYRFRRPDGTVVWIDGYASAFHDAQGALVGWVGACLDVTSHRRAELELWTQAQTDPLTGLPNRRAFEELLAPVGAAAVVEEQVSLILVDIDRFKTINDTYGHGVGDQVLVAVGHTLRGRLRESDIAVRLGGDEFAVLARTRAPERLASLLLEAIRELDLEIDGSRLQLTASAGTAVLSSAGVGRTGLLEAADHALYRAKRQGRDRVDSHAAAQAS